MEKGGPILGGSTVHGSAEPLRSSQKSVSKAPYKDCIKEPTASAF